MVVMLVFTMMALGLNIVVGYAGLLDLGYVAFYAAGAYTAGWLASLSTSRTSSSTSSPRRGRGFRESTSRCGSSSSPRALFTAIVGIADRPADASPPRGLPRDRHPRIRGDRPAVRAERRRARARLQPDERRQRDQPDRLVRVRRLRVPEQSNKDDLLLGGDRARSVHGLLLRPAPRLAARPSVDRDPRGRDRRCRDGGPAHADEDLVVCHRGLLRRHRGRLLRELQARGVPGRLLLQLLDLPAVHGHPRRDGLDLGRRSRRA